MIPILYTPLETDFTSNGKGRLAECISCTVTEERNGIFECEFEYPINGKYYDYLINNACFVGVIHDDHHDVQPFEVYRHSDPIDGIVTFNAHHISYNLGNVIVNNIDADTCADAFDQFTTKNLTSNPFTFWTDKASSGKFEVKAPDNIRALLCGKQGSILDIYAGGEYEFDKYDVKLYVNRGQDRGVTIRYGKNLADINRVYDASGIFNAVVPYWSDMDGNVITLPEGYVAEPNGYTRYEWENEINGQVMQDGRGVDIEFAAFVLKASPLDMSDQFEEQPTVEELRTAAQAFLTNNRPWLPSDNITVDFVQLWQTPEYEGIAALQRVSLCDTVSVYYPEMQVATSAKVIRIVYNVLTEQYDEMELGEARTTLAEALQGDFSAQIEEIAEENQSFTAQAIARATEKITGGLGGYVVMTLNANGEPQEILIMDTDDINTAINVIRMNKNGIGFSTNGYEGPYTSAWTIDGAFNADFITTGTMLANRIYGGTLTIGGLNNQAGVITVRDSGNTEVGRWNNNGIYLAKGSINFQDLSSYIRCPLDSDPSRYVQFDSNGMLLNFNTAGRLGTGYETYQDIPVGSFKGSYTYSGTTWDFYLNAKELNIGNSSGSQFVAVLDEVGNSYFAYYYRGSMTFYHDGHNNLSNTPSTFMDGYLQVNGDLYVGGSKSRKVKTKEYSDRLLYAYETPTPMFGDIGEGVLDDEGLCYVFLDPIFAETISRVQYQVFLQKYGAGDCWVSERKGGYFVVQGTAGLKFGWELKAKQKGYEQRRLDLNQQNGITDTDYGILAAQFLEELEEGRQVA